MDIEDVDPLALAFAFPEVCRAFGKKLAVESPTRQCRFATVKSATGPVSSKYNNSCLRSTPCLPLGADTRDAHTFVALVDWMDEEVFRQVESCKWTLKMLK